MGGEGEQMDFQKMTVPRFDVSGFETVMEALAAYGKKISSAYNVAKAETGEKRETLMSEAHRVNRQWRHYCAVAESHIEDDADGLADYEMLACILNGVPEDKRKPAHAALWKAVEAWRKGWVSKYTGKEMDTECFNRLIDYVQFRDAVSDFASAYSEFIPEDLT
jgi:hypothetical protein